jgi:hypothetical protein
MDAREIVDDIYRHAKTFMHKGGMVMQLDYVGKPEDLYLWCLIRQSKTCWEYACPMRISCGCRKTLLLETIGVHDQQSHTGGKMHASKSRLALVSFLVQRAKNLQITNLVGGASLIFQFVSN